jgi:hypothetical protein
MATLVTRGMAIRLTHMVGEIATTTIPTSTFTMRGKGITTKGIIRSSITVAARLGMRVAASMAVVVASTVAAAVDFTAVAVAEAMAAVAEVAIAEILS